MSCDARTRLGIVTLLMLCGSACAKTEPIQSPKIERAHLSKGTCPIIHCDTYQSDALPMKGPEAPSQALDEETIDHLWSSPIAGGILDYTYSDGTTVFWVSQVDRIMKLRLDDDNRLQKVTELPLEPQTRFRKPIDRRLEQRRRHLLLIGVLVRPNPPGHEQHDCNDPPPHPCMILGTGSPSKNPTIPNT